MSHEVMFDGLGWQIVGSACRLSEALEPAAREQRLLRLITASRAGQPSAPDPG